MTRRLSVANDIPDLLSDAQRLARQAFPDEQWWADRNRILRGALLGFRTEMLDAIIDNEEHARDLAPGGKHGGG